MAKLAGWGLTLLVALAVGVGGAGGHSVATTTTVRVEVLGVGTVTDDKNSTRCGNGETAACRVMYIGAGTVTFDAAPAAGWTFTGWDGDCSGSTCSITLDQADDDHEVIADFDHTPAVGTRTLGVTVSGGSSGGGMVSGEDIDCDTDGTDCDTEVPQDSTLTIVATPDTGFVFGGWGGSCAGTGPSCTLTMSVDRTVTATFVKPKLTVTVIGNGTVTGGGIACTSSGGTSCMAEETAGQSVTLTATAPAGGSFTEWRGACTGKNTCTVSMTSDQSVTAVFSGGSSAPNTFPLSVSVTGAGTVTGGGVNCGNGGSVCSANIASGSNVTLTATPAAGATFTSWGGACTGTKTTCAVAMTSAKNVSATFSGASAATVLLSVAVTGRGTVTGGGISCGNGSTKCSAAQARGATVGLTATPAAGATFSGWSGACSGTTPTCTVQANEATQVSATFRGGAATTPATGSAALRSGGAPVVKRLPTGFQVTLRFKTGRGGSARVLALRAGRVETALAFPAPSGAGTIGPFPVARPGLYTFELHLGARVLTWRACLGRCGERAASAPFRLVRERPRVVDAGALWSVTLAFRSTRAAGVVVRVYRGRTLARELRFPAAAGPVSPGALLLSPGVYRVRLVATDAVGRARILTWYAVLP